MLLARGEFEFGETSIGCASLSGSDQGAVVVHLSVDQIAVREWRRAARCCHDLLNEIIVIRVVPIREKDWADINVIWYVLGAMNDYGCPTLAERLPARVAPRLTSNKAGVVLSAVMGVVPGSTVEISSICISHAFPGSNGALLNRGNTVVPGSRFLQKSVPVQGSAFLWTDDVIANSSRDGIAPVDFNRWSRERSVDEQSAAVHTVRGDEATGDVEMEVPRDTCIRCQRRQWVRTDTESITRIRSLSVGVGVVDGVSAPWKAIWQRLKQISLGFKNHERHGLRCWSKSQGWRES